VIAEYASHYTSSTDVPLANRTSMTTIVTGAEIIPTAKAAVKAWVLLQIINKKSFWIMV
jgi:hypothetical protein